MSHHLGLSWFQWCAESAGGVVRHEGVWSHMRGRGQTWFCAYGRSVCVHKGVYCGAPALSGWSYHSQQ